MKLSSIERSFHLISKDHSIHTIMVPRNSVFWFTEVVSRVCGPPLTWCLIRTVPIMPDASHLWHGLRDEEAYKNHNQIIYFLPISLYLEFDYILELSEFTLYFEIIVTVNRINSVIMEVIMMSVIDITRFLFWVLSRKLHHLI